jgi:HEAT repeat protein
MTKTDRTEQALGWLSALEAEIDDDAAARELKAYLSNRSNLVVAKAAKIARARGLSQLVPDLVNAFEKLMTDPAKLDKRCAALTEIAMALYEMDYSEPDVYRKGIAHVQMEPSFGPPVDAAAALRGICAQGLVRTRDPRALEHVVTLLADSQAPARVGAVRALSTNGGEASALVLRLKALLGDRDIEVIAECFSGLLTAQRDGVVEFVAGFADLDGEETCEAAILALGDSRLSKAVEFLKEKYGRTARASTRKALLLALATSRDEDALSFLIALLENANVETATNVITALSVHKSSERIRQAVSRAVDRSRKRELIDAFRREFAEALG